MASDIESTLVQLTHGLHDLLELQRSYRQEAESNWAALAERGQLLEDQFLALWNIEAEIAEEGPFGQSIGLSDVTVENGQHIDSADCFQSGGPTEIVVNGAVAAEQCANFDLVRAPEQNVNNMPETVASRLDHGKTLTTQMTDGSTSKAVSHRSFYEEIMEEQTTECEALQEESSWKRWVRSPQFDLLVGVLIVFNTIVMSFQLEYTGRVMKTLVIEQCVECSPRVPIMELLFEIMEQLFTALFALELALRLSVDGVKYLYSVANLGDALIVMVSSVDAWVLSPMGSDAMSNVAILRLLRLVKLSKVFRVVRVMKAFRSLRVLVTAVAASVGALGWSMTLLFVLEMIGAIFLAQVIQPFIEDPDTDADMKIRLWRRFGTWYNSMLTIFEVTMAPGGFMQYRFLVDEVHPLFGLFFICYVCIVTFAVVRVITAMFLKATLAASDQDEDKAHKHKVQERKAYARRLEAIVDADGSGGINFNELFRWLQTQRMQEWLADAGLNPHEAERLFHALDPGTGEIQFVEFIAALERMTSPPRAADIVVMLMESKQMMDRLCRLEQACLGDRILKWTKVQSSFVTHWNAFRSRSSTSKLAPATASVETKASPVLTTIDETFFQVLVEKATEAVSGAIAEARLEATTVEPSTVEKHAEEHLRLSTTLFAEDGDGAAQPAAAPSARRPRTLPTAPLRLPKGMLRPGRLDMNHIFDRRPPPRRRDILSAL